MSLHFEVKCSTCGKPLILRKRMYRFTCMCDEDIRAIHEDAIGELENQWRVHLPEKTFTFSMRDN